ncbi:MAG: hypothetical protein P8M30_03965 [Planctomycetaceae bacterium]|nr:hypothetical protein [Planctomycetaceae bacterium]
MTRMNLFFILVEVVRTVSGYKKTEEYEPRLETGIAQNDQVSSTDAGYGIHATVIGQSDP